MAEVSSIKSTKSIIAENLKRLVEASKKSGNAIVLPIMKEIRKTDLAVKISNTMVEGYVSCDNMRRIDLNKRGHFSKGSISLNECIQVLDIVMSVLD